MYNTQRKMTVLFLFLVNLKTVASHKKLNPVLEVKHQVAKCGKFECEFSLIRGATKSHINDMIS